jgi:hypothetical protein
METNCFNLPRPELTLQQFGNLSTQPRAACPAV